MRNRKPSSISPPRNGQSVAAVKRPKNTNASGDARNAVIRALNRSLILTPQRHAGSVR